jgi:hypothetical protein
LPEGRRKVGAIQTAEANVRVNQNGLQGNFNLSSDRDEAGKGSLRQKRAKGAETMTKDVPLDLDGMTDMLIKANFDDEVTGRLLNYCIDRSGTVEGAIAFAAIVAKARLARKRRGTR